ncbi:MFS transporter [Telmatospirillum sp.]|uniref:MFS transporter n=1 Tax=Telmatospirillum sp. TaxID=2079197 RepID=UPI002846A949|nr:MFS transporter [Telmatospirillum sp.]MDR3438159.1 MFS transporter [Telmatospirillum sp.]
MTSIASGTSKNIYFPMAMCLYVSYFVHGMGVITLAQNMSYLMARYETDAAGIASVISFIGIGRLVSLFFFGDMSDRFGRRPMFVIGAVFYVIFFLGILVSPNIPVACAMAVCAGAANSSLDTCCYPALMEAYPKATGTSVILLKASVSLGQMLYPFIVGYLMVEKLWYGYAMLIPAVILFLTAVVILGKPFPQNSSRADTSDTLKSEIAVLKVAPKIWLEGTAAALFGYTAFAAFYIVVVWMPKYAQQFSGMAEPAALKTISYYSLGSLICVFISAFLVKKLVRPVHLMFLFSVLAGLMGLAVFANPTPLMCNLAAFVIGFTAAGGVLQLGVTLMSEFFPKSKARVTSIFMIFGSVSNFTIPLITGAISKVSIKYIMLFDAGMAFASAILSLIMLIRFYQTFSIPQADRRLGEGRSR